MKRKILFVLCGITAAALLTGCGNRKAETQEESGTQKEAGTQEDEETQEGTEKVTEVDAATYVGPDGRLLDKIVYKVSSADAVSLKPEDFTIDVSIAPVEYLGETESTQKTLEVISVDAADGEVSVDFDDLAYSTLESVTIDCTNDAYDAEQAEFTVLTRTADEFAKDTFTSSDGTEITYFLYMPENMENIPLMVWEHGGGEVLESSYEGANLHASRGAVVWVEQGYETAVLSVQYPANYSFGISEISEELEQMEKYNTAKYELIQKLITEGRIDARRVYISGASSGGGGALRFVMQYPDFFAAALVTSAKDTIIPLSTPYDLAYKFGDNELLKITDEEYEKSYQDMTDYMKEYDITGTPIWFVQAEHDQICTSYTSRMLYDVLEKMGAKDNKLTLYTDDEMEAAGQHGSYHGCWAVAFEDKEMTDWVYAQSR